MDFSKGATVSGGSYKAQTWTILGEPYRPLHVSDSAMLMHAEFNSGSMVPPHVHEDQDEILYILEGQLEFEMEGEVIKASAGDTVSLPMGVPHSLHNRSEAVARALVTVTPVSGMYDYMVAIDGLADPGEVVRLGPEHKIRFV